MNTEEYLLTKLAEEAAEIIQATSKILRFGWGTHHPDKKTTNAQELVNELLDLATVVDLLQDGTPLGRAYDEADFGAKALKLRTQKLEKYGNISHKLGRISEPVNLVK